MAQYVKGNRSTTLRLQRSTLVPCTPPEEASSPIPPPGKRALRFSLGKQIGEGACGLVYEATDVSLSGPSPKALPPLAVKICQNFQHYKLPIEAAIYEEMRSVHGVITARYYGCFETLIRPGISFPVWDPEDKGYRRDVTERDHPNISRVLSIIVMERLGDQHLPVNRSFDKSLQYVISVLILCVIVTYFYNLVVSCYVCSAISAIWAFRMMTCDGPTS